MNAKIYIPQFTGNASILVFNPLDTPLCTNVKSCLSSWAGIIIYLENTLQNETLKITNTVHILFHEVHFFLHLSCFLIIIFNLFILFLFSLFQDLGTILTKAKIKKKKFVTLLINWEFTLTNPPHYDVKIF